MANHDTHPAKLHGRADEGAESGASDVVAAARVLKSALLLEFAPVAITTLPDDDALDAFPAPRPCAGMHHCSAVREAADGNPLTLTAEDIVCDTCSKVLGMETGFFAEEFIDSYADGGLYSDHSVARELLGDVAVLPPMAGIAVVPLEQQPSGLSPDVVVVMTDAHGAMRIAQAAGFLGHRLSRQMLGMHGMCAESTAAPILSGEIGVSLLCSGARHTGRWPDHVLSVGIPGALLDDVVSGLRLTVDRFEPDRHKALMHDSKAELGDLESGSAYFVT